MATALTPEQAVLVTKLRVALAALGYEVPHLPHGATADLAYLVALSPVIGKFVASLEPAISRRVRAEKDPMLRARLITEAALARATFRNPNTKAKLGEALGILGQGFVAYRAAQKDASKVKTVFSVIEKLTAAMSR